MQLHVCRWMEGFPTPNHFLISDLGFRMQRVVESAFISRFLKVSGDVLTFWKFEAGLPAVFLQTNSYAKAGSLAGSVDTILPAFFEVSGAVDTILPDSWFWQDLRISGFCFWGESMMSYYYIRSVFHCEDRICTSSMPSYYFRYERFTHVMVHDTSMRRSPCTLWCHHFLLHLISFACTRSVRPAKSVWHRLT